MSVSFLVQGTMSVSFLVQGTVSSSMNNEPFVVAKR